jgi:upstream activation factor subunit UAF30
VLKDPSDRRKIICDEKLKDLFQVDSFTGFTVSKLLNPHFTKAA